MPHPFGTLRAPALTLLVAAGFFMAMGQGGRVGAAQPLDGLSAVSALASPDLAPPSAGVAGARAPGASGGAPGGGSGGGAPLRVTPLEVRHQPPLDRRGARVASIALLGFRSADALARAGLHRWGTTAPPPFRFA